LLQASALCSSRGRAVERRQSELGSKRRREVGSRPGPFRSYAGVSNIAALMHEVIHGVTGLVDEDIERLLDVPQKGQPGYMGSFGISIKLTADCVFKGHLP